MRFLFASLTLIGVSSWVPLQAGGPNSLRAVDDAMFEAQDQGFKLNAKNDRAGAIRVFRKGLADGLPALKSRPELQIVIQVELAAQATTKDYERLYSVLQAVRHSINKAGPPTGVMTKPTAAEVSAAFKEARSLTLDAARVTGKLKESAEAYELLIAKAVQTEGTETIFTADRLNSLGLRYTDLGEFAKALPALRRSVELFERYGAKHLKARRYVDLGLAAKDMAEFDTAEAQLRKALKFARDTSDENSPEVATCFYELARLSESRGQFEDAKRHYQDCLAIYRKTTDARDQERILPEWVRCLNQVAGLHFNLSDHAEAEKYLQQSLKKLQPTDKLAVAQCYQIKARLHRVKGEYDQAENAYKVAIDNVKAIPPALATCKDDLATFYELTGRPEAALKILEENLAFRVKLLGNNHPQVAETLNNIGLVYRIKKDYSTAVQRFEQSLEIRRTKLTENHPAVANAYNNLAAVYVDIGKNDKAKDYYLRAIEIQKRTLGADSTDLAITLDNLGMLHHKMGEFTEAERRLREGLAIRQKKLPAMHHFVALSHNHLAVTLAAQGRMPDAVRAFDADRRIMRQYVTRVLPLLTISQQLRFVHGGMEERDLRPALSLGYRAEGDVKAAVTSAEWLLNGKAIAHQAMAESLMFARGNKNAKVNQLLHDLEVARRKLSSLTIVQNQQEFERLTQEEQSLATALQREGSRLGSSEPWVEFRAFCKQMPRDAAFIDIARFQPFDFKAGFGDKKLPARYVAWITLPSGSVKVEDLGEADAIDKLIKTVIDEFDSKVVRKRLRADGEELAEQALAKVTGALAQRIMHPLLKHIGSQKQWILCPDGDLWLVPWNALPMPTGKGPRGITYAVENHTISYVTSGRDLVSAARPKNVKPSQPVIFADPDFDLDKTGFAKELVAVRGTDGPDNFRSIGATRAVLRNLVAQRLSGTATEALLITPSLRAYAGAPPNVFLEEKALKFKLRTIANPRVLILSTHGFFLERSAKDAATEDNPLLRCGLLFAGCNDKQARDQGIMTGLEVLDMDLRGCELVVLSACQTGLGESRDGEGVAGLRQCFQLAGADAVVASLWEVPDSATAPLMEKFFQVLAKNNDKAEALAEAQRHMIKTRDEAENAAHPLFWAAFTLTGRSNR